MKVRKNGCGLLGCVTLLSLVVGCTHVYQDKQLIGSWQLESRTSDARFTYYPNHTWALVVTSSDSRVPSGTAFGSWKLTGDRISVITESTLDNKPSRKEEIATVVTLTSSSLTIINQESNGAERTSSFHRIDVAAAVPSDEECAQKLQGTWLYLYTNKVKSAGLRAYSSYQSDGKASWHGTIYRGTESSRTPNALGKWRVEHGYLITGVTNSEGGVLPTNTETRDEIIQITDSQFSYRDESGTIKKELRME